MVLRAELQVARDPIGGDLIKYEAGDPQKGAGILERSGVKARGSRAGPADFSVHCRCLQVAAAAR
jgi:hypothetical protein